MEFGLTLKFKYNKVSDIDCAYLMACVCQHARLFFEANPFQQLNLHGK